MIDRIRGTPTTPQARAEPGLAGFGEGGGTAVRRRQGPRLVRRAVRQAITRVDPWGLIEMGGPDDEYEDEAEMILAELADVWPDQQAIADLVAEKLAAAMPGCSVPAEVCHHVAMAVLVELYQVCRFGLSDA